MPSRQENTEYFKRFFAEKKLPLAQWRWEIEAPSGTMHYIDAITVIDAIYVACDVEQTSIRNMLVRLDFVNAPPETFFDYLKHLAQCLVQMYEKHHGGMP